MSSRPNTPALCHSPTINYLQSLSIKYLDPSQKQSSAYLAIFIGLRE